VALLTNGALLHLPDVRAAARAAHVVKASLSAWDDASFGRVNRPAPGLRFEAVVQGERAFREEFSGELWLEVFILNGINDATENVGQIAALAATIRPDRIHLNTVVRPPATAGARPVSREALERLAGLFTPQAEVIADFAPHRAGGGAADGERLLAALARHPATAEQMARAFGVDRQRIDALVNQLLSEGKVEVSVREGEPYYVRAAGIDGA
jgi:wyosine [tRNA(Phe)-imidazoG37] synthetase (radical SAM superfamily)